MTMHPYAAEELAHQNERELRSSAQRHAPLGPRRQRRYPDRRRAWLVAVLRVARVRERPRSSDPGTCSAS